MADSFRFQYRNSNKFRFDYKRTLSLLFSSRWILFTLIWAIGFILIVAWQRTAIDRFWIPPPRPIPRLRSLVFSLTDFGAVGDGVTLNTKAFERAVAEIRKRGGGQLNVEAGRWLTAPFNLTSHMTLFLSENSVVLGTDVSTPFLVLPKWTMLVRSSDGYRW